MQLPNHMPIKLAETQSVYIKKLEVNPDTYKNNLLQNPPIGIKTDYPHLCYVLDSKTKLNTEQLNEISSWLTKLENIYCDSADPLWIAISRELPELKKDLFNLYPDYYKTIAEEAIKEVFDNYGLVNKALLPKIEFNTDASLEGSYSTSKHLIEINPLKSSSIKNYAKHEAVHAVFSILQTKIKLQNPKLYREKLVDGLVKLFDFSPPNHLITHDGTLLTQGLSPIVLIKIKNVLLNFELNLENEDEVKKVLRSTGIPKDYIGFIAYLANIWLLPLKDDAKLSDAVNSIVLNKKQFDLGLKSIQELSKYFATSIKRNQLKDVNQMGFFETWLTKRSWVFWKNNLNTPEARHEGFKEYLNTLEEIVARLSELPESNPILNNLVKVYRSQSNPSKRADVIRVILKEVNNLPDKRLKEDFTLVISKMLDRASTEMELVIGTLQLKLEMLNQLEPLAKKHGWVLES